MTDRFHVQRNPLDPKGETGVWGIIDRDAEVHDLIEEFGDDEAKARARAVELNAPNAAGPGPLVHWIVTDGSGVQRPVQTTRGETAAIEMARQAWPELQGELSAYPHAEVDENGCHAHDGQKLLTPDEHRAALLEEERQNRIFLESIGRAGG